MTANEPPARGQQPSHPDACEALTGVFLANAAAGDNDANDDLVAEYGRRLRQLREGSTP
jgi:hypothetical protein